MTPQTILDSSNPNTLSNTQYTVINEDDAVSAGIHSILTPAELAASENVNAIFYAARIQVPNSYEDPLNTGVKTAQYDHSNPVYKDFDMVKVRMVDPDSQRVTEVHHYVSEFHIKRWPHRWRAYKQGKSMQIDGTELNAIGVIPELARLKFQEAGVFTVEQLAKVSKPENIVANGAKYQEHAKQFLSKTSAGKTEDLEQQVKELQEQLAALLKAKK